jgi:hypothetical protein
MSTSDNSAPSPGPVDHSRCDFAGKPVRCERCGREFVCTPWDDLYCAAEGDHCGEGCLLAGHPKPLIVLDPIADVSRLGPAVGSDSSRRGDAR